MRWEEASDPEASAGTGDAVDVAFRLSGRWLPVDHAFALRDAVMQVLPWLADTPEAGIHSIHGAASGNGWERPGRGTGEMLSLSRRTRLRLRVPGECAEEAGALCGQRLDINGCEIVIGAHRPQPLTPAATVFARYVVDEEGGDEERFVERVALALEALSVPARKLLCGHSYRIESAPTALCVRSLLIADLGPGESLVVQSRGIGPGRLLGCGLFVPHKDLGPVRGATGDD